jgi:hypothetical protein
VEITFFFFFFFSLPVGGRTSIIAHREWEAARLQRGLIGS